MARDVPPLRQAGTRVRVQYRDRIALVNYVAELERLLKLAVNATYQVPNQWYWRPQAVELLYPD